MTPNEAFAMGAQSRTGELKTKSGDQITADKCPIGGSMSQYASDTERAGAYLRDCWFAGFTGATALPPLAAGHPDPAQFPALYPPTPAAA